MKVASIFPFFDADKKCKRRIGDSWECSKERFEAINSTVFGTLVKECEKKPAKKDKE